MKMKSISNSVLAKVPSIDLVGVLHFCILILNKSTDLKAHFCQEVKCQTSQIIEQI